MMPFYNAQSVPLQIIVTTGQISLTNGGNKEEELKRILQIEKK